MTKKGRSNLNDDKRLYFIRNIEAIKKGDTDIHIIEYEIITDTHIVGKLKYGPYYFTLWEYGLKQKGEERKLCLRIHERAFPSVYQPEKPPQRSGYYHGGSIADELVYLASLFLRRRFILGPIVRWNDEPSLFSKDKTKWLDKQLITGKSNLEELTEWLQLAEGLDKNFHQRFILAARLYHRAILFIEEQPDMAYLDLISAIEILSNDHDIGNLTLADLDNPKLENYVRSVDNEELRCNLEENIVKLRRFIKRRFIAFMLCHTEESFWTEKERPQHGKIQRKDLARLLGLIYKQRSKTLHNGEPFPAYIYSTPPRGEEISSSLGISKGEKMWEPKEFIPYPHFFERLVNHVLKTFLKRHQVERENTN